MIGYKKQRLPNIGDAFLVPLEKKANTFCWVARLHEVKDVYGGRKLGDYKMHSIVIACATWTGPGKPTQAELDVREVRDAYDLSAKTLKPIGKLALVSSEPPPKRWVKLGRVHDPDISAALIVAGTTTLPDGTKKLLPSWAGFTGLHDYALRAWKMRRSPTAVLAAEAAADAAVEAHNAAQDAADEVPIALRRKATLAQLATVDLLPEWKGLVAPAHRTAVCKLLATGVSGLRKLGSKATRAAKIVVIKQMVEAINAWNDRTGAIETPEREALCVAIDDIGRAAGLRGEDLAGPYRDW